MSIKNSFGFSKINRMARSKAGSAPRRGKKGKRKGGKKKKKKVKKVVNPPPLHLLSELYTKLEDATRRLYEMRLLSRKKRLEGWLMARETASLSADNDLYHEYLNEGLGSVEELLVKIKKEIDIERKSLQDEIDRLQAELRDKLIQASEAKAKLEYDLQNIRNQLLEYQPLMVQLQEIYNGIEEVTSQIRDAQSLADISTRHLKNQYLSEREKLYKHLEEQLCKLIMNVRGYLMPSIRSLLQSLESKNACYRWRLRRVDARNLELAQQRENLLEERRMLSLEKEYWKTDWIFQKFAEIKAKRRAKRHEEKAALESPKQIDQPPTELAMAFNIYLKKRLCGIKGARIREEQRRRIQQRALEPVLGLDSGQNRNKRYKCVKGSRRKDGDENSPQKKEEEKEEWTDLDGESENESSIQYVRKKTRPESGDKERWRRIAESIYYSNDMDEET